MHKSHGLLPLLALAFTAFAPHTANATVFPINCGVSGPTAALQSQIISIGSSLSLWRGAIDGSFMSANVQSTNLNP